EGEVDRGGVVGRLQRGIDRGWGLGGGDEVLGRREGHHRLAVVVELAGGTVARRDHPELVGSLQGDLTPRRVDEGRPEAARALVADHRRERHRVSSGQAAGRGLQEVDRLGFERRLDRMCGCLARRLGWLRSPRRWLRLGLPGRRQEHTQREQQRTERLASHHRGALPTSIRIESSPSDTHGIIPHSNILLTMGAATRLMKAVRRPGLSRSFCMASCSIGGFFWPFLCQSCSQLACWYFWMTLSAIMSSIGSC